MKTPSHKQSPSMVNPNAILWPGRLGDHSMTVLGIRCRMFLRTMFHTTLFSVPSAFAQDCTGGSFQGNEPYSFDESSPFDFYQSAGWVAQSTLDGQRIVTISKPEGAMPLTTVTIDIVVALQEATRLRDLFIESLTPNADTTFSPT